MRSLKTISKDIVRLDKDILNICSELSHDYFIKVKNNQRKLKHLLAQLPKKSTVRQVFEIAVHKKKIMKF